MLGNLFFLLVFNLLTNSVLTTRIGFIGRYSCKYGTGSCPFETYTAQSFFKGLIDGGIYTNGSVPNSDIRFVFMDPFDHVENITSVEMGDAIPSDRGLTTKTTLSAILGNDINDPLIAIVGSSEDCRAASTIANSYDIAAVMHVCDDPIGEPTIPLPYAINLDKTQGLMYRGIAFFMKSINWTHVSILSDPESTNSQPSELLDALAEQNITVANYDTLEIGYFTKVFPFQNAQEYVLRTYLSTRIYICISDYNCLSLLYAMDRMGLLETGQYFLICITTNIIYEKFSFKSFYTSLRERGVLSNDQIDWIARHYIRFTFVPSSPYIESTESFINVKKEIMESFNQTLCPPFCGRDTSRILNNADTLSMDYGDWGTAYDLGKMFGETLALHGSSISNGSQIIDILKQRVYTSSLGYDTYFDSFKISQRMIYIWSAKDMITSGPYDISQYMTPFGKMVPSANGSFGIFMNLTATNIYLQQLPKDRPKCGFKNELCPSKTGLSTVEIIVIVVSCIVGLVLIGFMAYVAKWIAYERRLESSYYVLSRRDITLQDFNKFGSSRAGSLMASMLSMKSMQSMNGNDELMPGTMEFYSNNIRRAYKRKNKNNGKSEINTDAWKDILDWQLAKLDNVLVTVRKIQKENLKLTREMKQELDNLMNSMHENLNKFHGIIIEPGLIFTIHSFGLRKSLSDLVRNPDLRLDKMFKVSFIEDIMKGLSFLHDKSKIGYHGNLKSTNCIVDAYWRVKLSTFGLEKIRADEPTPKPDDLLWFAPEVLRLNCRKFSMEKEDLARADMYSLGIILYEVYGREGPYGDDLLDSAEIVEQLKNPVSSENPTRPDLEIIRKAPIPLLETVKACWEEDPHERPTIRKVRDKLRPLGKGLKGNIADNIMELLDRYRYNLEDVIKERTDELEEERRRNERLLLQLLPSSVADSLKNGRPVEAEFFDSITIYFSDIVGFTALSSKSTPMQVVNMLNDLYTDFDQIIDRFDCYKIETIGDAYMYVSGLPTTNGIHHAGEVASASYELLQAIQTFKIRHAPDDHLRLRIGLHSGPVVTGVVGVKMPRYCLFGDTVITASNMESSGEAMKIQVSVETYELLSRCGGYEMQRRGEVQLASKAMKETFWLHTYNPEVRLNRLQNSMEKFPQFAALIRKANIQNK